jgi:hypothetical protein
MEVLGKLIKFRNHEFQNSFNYLGRATDKNFICLLDSQAVIKVLNNFQINSTWVWHCCQPLVKLTEHDRVQLLCMLGYMGIDGSEIADH